MYLILLLKRIKLIIVAIDLDKFRSYKYNDRIEKRIYRKAAAVIAQTEKMKDVMLENGYVTPHNKVYIGNFWTILSKYNPEHDTNFGYTLAYCGNFKREAFILRLPELGNDFKFNVYCNKDNFDAYGLEFHSSDGIARRIQDIEGAWGLVWEGDMLETCTGHYREYLKMVYSYKASLYIAAGKPLIVWSGSAIADIVSENKLGIVVDNLFEIHEKIASLTVDDKLLMCKNVRRWSEIVRSGSDRMALFRKICNEI